MEPALNQIPAARNGVAVATPPSGAADPLDSGAEVRFSDALAEQLGADAAPESKSPGGEYREEEAQSQQQMAAADGNSLPPLLPLPAAPQVLPAAATPDHAPALPAAATPDHAPALPADATPDQAQTLAPNGAAQAAAATAILATADAATAAAPEPQVPVSADARAGTGRGQTLPPGELTALPAFEHIEQTLPQASDAAVLELRNETATTHSGTQRETGLGAVRAPEAPRAESPMSGVASTGSSPSRAVESFQAALALHRPGWEEGLGSRVLWQVNQQVQRAELHLNPPDLGPLEVQITMEQGEARIQFLSHHAAVREAVEGAIPRLREMLGESGVQLGDVNVSHHSAADAQARAGGSGAGRPDGAEGSRAADAGAELRSSTLSGLLDVYV